MTIANFIKSGSSIIIPPYSINEINNIADYPPLTKPAKDPFLSKKWPQWGYLISFLIRLILYSHTRSFSKVIRIQKTLTSLMDNQSHLYYKSWYFFKTCLSC